jgi:hypothetical protein
MKYDIFKLEPIKTLGKPGELVNIDLNKICSNYNFTIHKCFYINELDSILSRGNHSNYNASEILICTMGSFMIKLHDGEKEEIFFIRQNEAIFINKDIWIEFFEFKNCVILVLVNILNEKSSCYNFEDFLKKKYIK